MEEGISDQKFVRPLSLQILDEDIGNLCHRVYLLEKAASTRHPAKRSVEEIADIIEKWQVIENEYEPISVGDNLIPLATAIRRFVYDGEGKSKAWDNCPNCGKPWYKNGDNSYACNSCGAHGEEG